MIRPAASPIRDEALAAIFAVGARILQARRLSLYLRGDDHALFLCSEIGLPRPSTFARITPRGSIMDVVMRTEMPLLVRDIAAYPALPARRERYATPSFLSVPILAENTAAGVLNAADRADGDPFSEDDLQDAERLARAIGAVLQEDVLLRRALDTSETDPTTGLYARAHLSRRLGEEGARAQRDNAALSLLLLHVDGYAAVSAGAGAQAAGLLMKHVGEMVTGTVRRSDVLAAWSADTLAIVLPATPPTRARRVARELLREVRHDKLPAHLRYECERLSATLALAALGLDGDVTDLERRADDALRTACEQGETLVIAPGDQWPRADAGDASVPVVTPFADVLAPDRIAATQGACAALCPELVEIEIEDTMKGPDVMHA